MSQAFFLFAELRTPWHKWLMAIIIIVGFVIGLETFSKLSGVTLDPYPKPTGRVPPKI